MMVSYLFLVIWLLIVSTTIFQDKRLHAHELFSARADLARNNGVTIDNLIKYTRAGSQHEVQLFNRFMYGLTEFLTLEAKVPVYFEKKVSETADEGKTKVNFKANGLGKIELLSKVRIFRQYAIQKRNQIVLINGILLPTANRSLTGVDRKPIIGNHSLDFLTGIAGAFETLKFYHFASLTYRFNTSADQIQEGNQLSYSYAFGCRPKKPMLNKQDWVFLIDVDGIWLEKDRVDGKKVINSGSNTIFIGPSFFSSRDNVMVKGAVQFPILQHFNGIQEKNDFRGAVGIFVQF